MGRAKKEEDLGPEADENWKSKDPKALAYEIATFMGGSWPTRPVRKVQLSLDGVPTVRSGAASTYPYLSERAERQQILISPIPVPPKSIVASESLRPAKPSPASCIIPMHPAGLQRGMQRTARRFSHWLLTRPVRSCH
jgi:hypothetical protein